MLILVAKDNGKVNVNGDSSTLRKIRKPPAFDQCDHTLTYRCRRQDNPTVNKIAIHQRIIPL